VTRHCGPSVGPCLLIAFPILVYVPGEPRGEVLTPRRKKFSAKREPLSSLLKGSKFHKPGCSLAGLPIVAVLHAEHIYKPPLSATLSIERPL
jgi:hypothetical protein